MPRTPFFKQSPLITVTPAEKIEDIQLRKEAWVGDAILALYVREWILEQYGEIDGPLFIEFTSNDFLRRTGRPTAVEAAIGRAYKEGGVEAGFAWIEENLRTRMEERLRTLRGQKKPIPTLNK